MKKTLLAITLLSAFGVGVANAGYTDTMPSANLAIDGAILETNPAWKWQIPAEAIDAMRDITFKKDTGVVDGVNTKFTVANISSILIEGGSIDAATPAPGQFPAITVGGVDIDYTINQDVNINTTNNSGKLTLHINSALAYMQQYPDANGITDYWNARVSSDVRDDAFNAAKNVLAGSKWIPAQANIDQIFNRQPINHAWDVLTNPNGGANVLVIGAAAVELTRYEVTFPTNAIPSTWSATLPITVAMM